uniref:Coiled-coil domain containing 18 n=1 Tax=Chrysolophus pictus TaxID=9089 RepID=A0A8C3LER7_CHRPC
MECSVWARSRSDDEELLVAVESLRSQLRRTEESLQSVGTELSSTGTREHSHGCFDGAADLILEDLVQLNCNSQCSSNCKKTAGKTYCWDFQRKSKLDLMPTAFDKAVEENECLKEKLYDLHEQNASLASQNHYLKNRVETTNLELMESKTRISYLESTLGTHLVNIPKLEERIVTLEAEVSAQDKILRAEQQRNEALLNAEELTRVFQKYKEKITGRFEKVQAEGARLENYIINCEKEREKLNEKCVSYRKHLDIQDEQLRQLREENHNAKEEIVTLEAKNSEMMLTLNRSNQKILELEKELNEKKRVLKEKNALVSENAELRALNAQQHNNLKLCHQEMENSRQELNLLETIISQLSSSTSEEFNWHNLKRQLSSPSKEAVSESCESNKPLTAGLSIELATKEAETGKPHTNLTACNTVEHLLNDNERQEKRGLCGLEIEPVKLIKTQEERRKCQQLELVSKQFEKERQRFKKEMEKLRVKLAKLDNENLSLKTSMAQRTSQFQSMQEELSAKTLKTNTLKQEIAKKSTQLSALKKQLEEKAAAYSAAAARSTELEQELMGKNKHIHELETTVSEERKQLTSAFEKAKLMHLEQRREMEKQIELLQTQLDKKHQQFVEQETTISVLQQDIIHKQHHIESLDGLLMESREEMKKQDLKKDERLKILESQLNEQTIKVKQLESALDVCKEELALYLSQTEENKEMFQNQLKKKSKEVCYLQKEIKLKGRNLQDTSEQNILLQQTLHHQQQMLQQETIRTGELEDNQTKLEEQVSALEQELQKQKVYAEDELRKVEEKLCLACQEADLYRQKVDELNNIIRQKTLEMDEYNNELTGMGKEVVQLKQDIDDKMMQISHLDITLKEARSELRAKTSEVTALEDKLLQSETCHREALQKIEELESALQNAHGELKVISLQLQGLQDALQNAQLSLEEKEVAIMNLTAELRYCTGEIEDKKQELLDMDQALKKRNWELKQRAAQITQLDMTVREHKGGMEQQIIQLECNLEKSELEVKECNKQIESLENKLQHSKEELREKDFELLQRNQEINQLKKKMERQQQSLEVLEKTVKNQENCIGDQYREALDLGQQLKLEREQLQQTHSELLEARQMLVQSQREADRLTCELEEVNYLSQEKESRANRLAEELGAAKAREAQLELQMQSEINRLFAQISSLQDTCQIKLAHEKDQAKGQISAEHQKFDSYHLSEQLQQVKVELEEAQDNVTNLQLQLQVRDEMVRAASETLLVKVREL